MSYILEALKKSEEERKVGDSPNISSDHQLLQYRASGSSKLLWLLLAFVLLCCLLIIYFISITFLESDKETNNRQQKISQYIDKNFSDIDNTYAGRVYDESDSDGQGYQQEAIKDISVQAAIQNSVNDGDKDSTEGFELIRPNKERREALQRKIESDKLEDEQLALEYQTWFDPKERAVSQQDDVQKSNELIDQAQALPSTSEEGDIIRPKNSQLSTKTNTKPKKRWQDYKDIASLSSTLKQQLPSLKVSTHIYSNAASFRKVTINGIGAKQGDQISQDLFIDLITEEGVVFSFKGDSFKMKALESWDG